MNDLLISKLPNFITEGKIAKNGSSNGVNT